MSSILGPKHPLTALPSMANDMDPDLARVRAREQLEAKRVHGWPVGCVAIRDSREKNPWTFPVQQDGTLTTGDYSVEGLQDVAVIERKSLSDAWSSIGSGRGDKFKLSRDRFRREWERMAELRMACVIIEGAMGQLARAGERSMVDPATVIGTYRRWSCKYSIPVWFCDNRMMANRFAGLLLVDFWKMFRN